MIKLFKQFADWLDKSYDYNIEPGDIWEMEGTGNNPFAPNGGLIRYHVVAVRDGYVLYHFGNSQYHTSCTVDYFKLGTKLIHREKK